MDIYGSENQERKLVPVYSEKRGDLVELPQQEVLVLLKKEPLNQIQTELVDNERAESRGDSPRNITVYGNYNENSQGGYYQGSPNSEKPDSQNITCNIKKTGSANFVGREGKLEELHQLLKENEKVSVSARAGMGGIGKSELAQKMLRWNY